MTAGYALVIVNCGTDETYFASNIIYPTGEAAAEAANVWWANQPSFFYASETYISIEEIVY